jgi:hypothetical protein
MFSNKRNAIRRPVRCTAWIALKAKKLHGCVVSDISDSGARLNVENAALLPDEFLLFLSSRGTASRKCRVVWRKTKQIGVEFPLPRASKTNSLVKPTSVPRKHARSDSTRARADDESIPEPV